MLTQNYNSQNDFSGAQDDKAKKAARHRLEIDIVSLEAELSKNQKKLKDWEIDWRMLEKEKMKLDIQMEEKLKQKKKIEQDIFLLEADLKRMRAKMNNL